MNNLIFENLPLSSIVGTSQKLNHIDESDFNFKIPKIHKWQKDIFCNSFDDLSDSDRQEIADRYIRKHHFNLDTEVVSYILNQSWEDQNAPFSYDDIDNYDRTGNICINGYWEDITEQQKSDYLEKYNDLFSKWDDYLTDTLEDLINNVESEIEELEEGPFYNHNLDILQTRLKSLNLRKEKAEKKHSEIWELIQDLENLDLENEPEIFQWFNVDRDTANRLKEQGECILYDQYWGRCACGQSITLDHCIQYIAFEALKVSTNY